MTDEAARRRQQQRERRWQPIFARAHSRGVRRATELVKLVEAARAIEEGDLQTAAEAIFGEDGQAALGAELTKAIAELLLRVDDAVTRTELPAVLRVRRAEPTGAVVEALEQLRMSSITPIVRDGEDAVRQVLQIGLQEGANPRTVARWAREAIQLSPHDAKLIHSFRRQVTEDPTAALGRTLRDARHDSALRQAVAGGSIAPAKVDAMVDAYSRRLTSWRSETLSRTATLNALREGQLASWREAVAAAGLSPSDAAKTWVTTIDGRERPAHHAAHGATVLLEEPFPVDGGVQVPGTGQYNCRCTFTVRILPVDPAEREHFMKRPDRTALGVREERAEERQQRREHRETVRGVKRGLREIDRLETGSDTEARASLARSTSTADFVSFVGSGKSRDGDRAVALLDPGTRQLLGAKSRVVRLSGDTAAKQRGEFPSRSAGHPEITTADYRRLQGMIDRGEIIQEASKGSHYHFVQQDDRLFVAVTKVTGRGEVYLQSFRRTDDKNRARLRRRGRVLREAE